MRYSWVPFLLWICYTCPTTLKAQEIELIGNITDSLGQVLSNANVLALPIIKDYQIRFAISNQKGIYQLKLSKGVEYKLQVSYLGYKKVETLISLEKDEKKNFILVPSINELDEVVLNYTIPIEIKKDTIIYDTNAFINGKERKLREILKKLPGVEITREGNVKVKGRKVTKFMVESNTFFTGSGKLAVNNIPADAVDKIEILDNYSDISFLKGLEDSGQLAMNIRLKKDKKKFAFGDLEIGTGIKDRYLVHPTLFYYNPKTNINFIGDLNNTGAKSFTLTDYLEFEGGFAKLMSNTRSYFNLFNDDFSKYLANIDFKENTNQFGAFNLRQSITSKTDINTYVITNGSKTKTETRTINSFINNNPFSENRNTKEILSNFFIICKLTLDYEPNSNTDLSTSTFFKMNDNTLGGSIRTISPFQNNRFLTKGTLNNINLKQNLEYSKKFTKKQTISLETTFDYKKSQPNSNWITDQPFLSNLVSLENDSVFDLFQQIETENTSFDFIFKDYWILNSFNHIYTTFGTHIVDENYKSLAEQHLSNGNIKSFDSNQFKNDITYQFTDVFVGLEYKNLIGIFTSKVGLFYHNYQWKNEQFSNSISKSTKLILPQINIKAEFNSSEKLNFKYNVKTRFPNSPKLIGNFLLTNFNQVFRGKPGLANEKYHSLSLNYYKLRLFSGLNLKSGITYNKKTQSIKNTTEFQGIDQFRTYTMFNSPENSLNGRLNFSKKIKKIKYSIETDANYKEFFQIVNNYTSKNISKTLSTTWKIQTLLDKGPNLVLGYTYSPSIFITNVSSSNFSNNEFFANLEYNFFEDFQFKTDYSRVDYKNKDAGIADTFDIANVSLFYQKEDSAWGFEVEATNLFNTKFKRSNSFSDFLISDQTTFILPRILMFKVSYKL
jgi:hypothetical protein